MNFVLDESVPIRVAERLRAEGHDVVAITETSPGIDDEAVLDIARKTPAVLISADKDFGELDFRPRRAHAGVRLVRLAGDGADAKAQAISEAVGKHGSALPGVFAVPSPDALRIRP